ILAIACLYWARIVFIPIALALLVTFLLSPVVALLRRIGLHRVVAVVIVVTLTVAAVAGPGWALHAPVTLLGNAFPRSRAPTSHKPAGVQRGGRGGALRKVEEPANDVMARIDRANPPVNRPLPVVVSAPSPIWQIPKIVEPIGSAAFVLVLVAF